MSDGPLIVQSDKTVLLEVDHELAGAARAAIAPFAELEMREVLRAAVPLEYRPARAAAERAGRSMLVVVPERGGEIIVG